MNKNYNKYVKRRYEIISRRVINSIYLEMMHSHNLALSFLEKEMIICHK